VREIPLQNSRGYEEIIVNPNPKGEKEPTFLGGSLNGLDLGDPFWAKNVSQKLEA